LARDKKEIEKTFFSYGELGTDNLILLNKKFFFLLFARFIAASTASARSE
jgi:hypothetical protein